MVGKKWKEENERGFNFSTTKCQDLDPWVVFLPRFTESNQLNVESKRGKFKRKIKLVAQSQFKLKAVL